MFNNDSFLDILDSLKYRKIENIDREILLFAQNTENLDPKLSD